jgi:tRNA(Ile)-lysidine synthase
VTSSGTGSPADPAGLTGRAGRAFDILCGEADTIGIAVSGGSDSLALLMLAADWAEGRGKRIAAATVDHGLRPEAADEARGVAHICAELSISHSVLSWRRQPGGGAVGQAEARRARHALLAGWADDHDIRTVALGHTRDDRVETFLMRARQGSGWRGLAGPMPAGPSPVWPEGRGLSLARPLLAFARTELREELRTRDRFWFEDPSNEAERFERVRMRGVIRKLDAEARNKALRVMDGLASMRAAVLAQAREALERVATGTDEAGIPADVLRGLGAEARLRLIEALVMAAGGAETPPRREALKRLVERTCSGADSGGVTLAGAWVRVRAGEVLISQAPPRRDVAPAPDPDWGRARALLADPRLKALAV